MNVVIFVLEGLQEEVVLALVGLMPTHAAVPDVVEVPHGVDGVLIIDRRHGREVGHDVGKTPVFHVAVSVPDVLAHFLVLVVEVLPLVLEGETLLAGQVFVLLPPLAPTEPVREPMRHELEPEA